MAFRIRRPLCLAGFITLLASCSPDRGPTEPELPRSLVPVCPVGNLCGTTSNGVIHDGTGNGTLPVVAGDPSPGSPGIWLGNTRSGQWCYREYNSFITDADHDWLDDECEFQLAQAFAPALALNPNDGCPGGEPYWAAKYFSNNPYGTGEFVRIFYMPAYYKDCGPNLPLGIDGPHDGDSEFMMVGIHHNPTTRHWELREAFLSAHYHTANDHSIYTTDPTTLTYPSNRPKSYPLIWVAKAKHANYRTQGQCNAVNDCGGNVTVGRIKVYRNHNVGGFYVDFLPNGVLSQNPQFAGNGKLEYFYNRHPFGGWQALAAGVTPYADVLTGAPFECFDLNAIPGGVAYCGPANNTSPTSTTLLGFIEGPTSVTAYQQYTWTSFVTGGQVPYRAEWWQKVGAAAATLVGTSTGTWQGTTSTAGSLTLTVNGCQNFTLTLKVWSNDNQFRSDDHAVTIGSCPPPPPPPLTVSINGPGGITVKGTYTYTAVISGFTSPGYTWSQRYCTNGSCAGWTTLVGFTTSVSRVLTPDCTGTGNNWYEIRLVVRNSDGRSATATRQTGLCGGLN